MTKENKETDQEFKAQIIETIDEDGNTVELELIDIVDVEGVEYAVLAAVGEDEDIAGEEAYETEAVLMKLIRDGDNFFFETIDNDEEFQIVSEYIQSLNDEEE